jgi:hypothetical protein
MPSHATASRPVSNFCHCYWRLRISGRDYRKRPFIVAWLIDHLTGMARIMAWMGILAIIILSVVPAADRPVTGAGQLLEHLTAFAIVGGAFASGIAFH